MNNKRSPFPVKAVCSHAYCFEGASEGEKRWIKTYIRDPDTICRNCPGGGNGIFYEKGDEPETSEASSGFASGVMIAASVWSLLIPAIDMSEEAGGIAWIPAAAGFLLGMGFLLILDTLTPHLHFTEEKPEGMPSHLKKTTMLVLAVTLQNIPEGMAVGVTFAGAMTGNTAMTLAGAFTLSVGIAIQNFPEGAIISMPLKGQGISRKRAFVYGALSGIVEPVAAFLTILLTGWWSRFFLISLPLRQEQ